MDYLTIACKDLSLKGKCNILVGADIMCIKWFTLIYCLETTVHTTTTLCTVDLMVYWSFIEKTSVKQSMKYKVCSNFQMSFLHLSQMDSPGRGIWWPRSVLS